MDIEVWTHRQEAQELNGPNRCALPYLTQVWVVLSPFYGVHLDDYLKYLWLHMQWHAALGASRYLLYANANLTQLVAHPVVHVRAAVLV
jgi:hypothetical protein